MEVESSSNPPSKPTKSMQDIEANLRKRKRKRRNICLGVTAAAIIFFVLLIVILAFTVFKAKHPVTTIDSISLQDLSVNVDLPRLRVHINITVDARMSVKNPNKVGFKYSNSSAFLIYRGEVVGEAPIPSGQMSADKTQHMNISLTLMADRLLSKSQLYLDVIGGRVTLTSSTRLSGKVIILNIFRVHVVSSTTCDFTVFISNRTIGDQNCKYKTKL